MPEWMGRRSNVPVVGKETDQTGGDSGEDEGMFG